MSNRSSRSPVIFTPSSTPSLQVEEDDDNDPDTPLPSVECDSTSSPTSTRHGTPTSTNFTPSVSSYTSRTAPRSEDSGLNQQLENVRLNSIAPRPETLNRDSSQSTVNTTRSSSDPSINLTPTASRASSSRRTDSIVAGFDGMTINAPGTTSTPVQRSRYLDTRSPSLSADHGAEIRSPSPTHRRRSGVSPARYVHSVENEEPPHALRHAQEVQQSLNSARNAVLQIKNTLSASILHQEIGSSVERLFRQATDLSNFQPPSSRIVGLVGDSGVGKSSLINSLLDREDFARASNSGSACTCVVTEYHHHDRNDFILEVNYFTVEDLKTQFDDLLQALRDHNSSNGSNMTPTEVEDLENRASLAKDTFKAAFSHIPEFDLARLLSRPFQPALQSLLGWASDVLRSFGVDGQSSQSRETFSSDKECSTRMIKLTSDTEGSSEACPWPFIQKIRVYLKAHILSKGLIIADLPGLRDLNTARRMITERYIRECHQIFVVTRIGRAGSDESVKEVFRLGQRASLSNIGIICTQSDVIKANEAKDDAANASHRARIVAMYEEVQAANQDLRSLKDQLADFVGIPNRDLDEEERAEKHQLGLECSEVEEVLSTKKFELQRFIITLRNRTVTDQLEHDYRDQFAGRKSNVFCVSNTTYWEYRERRMTAPNAQGLDLSGIIDLRRYCIGIVAESHIRSIAEYITDSIPAFLGSVDLWVQAGSGGGNAERKQKILDAVSEVQDQLDELMSPVSNSRNISRSVKVDFALHVRAHMKERAEQWRADSKDASLEWQTWHHTSYTAFCVNYGDHYTKAIGRRCWNQEAISSMATNMTGRNGKWIDFMTIVEQHVDRIQRNIESVFEEARTCLSRAVTGRRGARHPLVTLIAALHHRRDLLLHGLEEAHDDLKAKLRALRTDAFSPIRTSIIGQILEPTYNTARRESGNGSWDRRKRIIANGFGSPDLFPEHLRRFRTKFVVITDEFQNRLNGLFDQQLELIEADLNTLRDENVVLESERHPEFRTRLGAEVERVGQEMENVKLAIQRVTDGLGDNINPGGSSQET